jgi:hypothetical protein
MRKKCRFARFAKSRFKACARVAHGRTYSKKNGDFADGNIRLYSGKRNPEPCREVRRIFE